ITIGVIGAAKEGPPPLGPPLGQVAIAAARAFHAQRNRARVLALRVLGAGEELPVTAGLDDHRRAAGLADLVRGPVRYLVALERLGIAAGRVVHAGDEWSETPAPHLQLTTILGTALLFQVTHVMC